MFKAVQLNAFYLIGRSSHFVKEPVSALHRLSQRRRRTYSDTDTCNDISLEDPDSKLDGVCLSLIYSAKLFWVFVIVGMKNTDK